MAATDTSSQQGVTLPLVAVPGGVVFPGTVVTLTLDADEARLAIEAARVNTQRVLLVPRHEGRYASVGVIAAVESVGDLPMGGRAAILRGVQRGRVGAAVASEQGGLWVNVEPVAEGVSATPIEEPVRELRAVLQNIAELRGSRRLPEILRTIAEPGALADAVTAWSEAAAEHQIDVLEAVDVGERLAVVLTWAREHLAELQVARQIRDGVADGVEKQQREFLLRQQLQAIRKELGDSDDEAGDDYRAKFDALPLPVKVREAVDKELDRLERTSGQSPEQGWIRTWLDRVLDLPWGKTTDDRLDLSEARGVLDADHEGLDDVKERIVEFLAVRKLRTERGLAASPEATDDDVRQAGPPPGRRRHRGPGRPSGCGQDQPRGERRPGHGPQLRARGPRRRA